MSFGELLETTIKEVNLMNFEEFAKKLKPLIGGSYNSGTFTKSLFESIVPIESVDLLRHFKIETYRSYYKGSSIGKIAKTIIPYLDAEQFVEYIDSFESEDTAQNLSDAFEKEITDITPHNASEKIAYLFKDIIKDAASAKRKSTPKSADKNSHSILEEKILASGQAVADAWGNAVSNLVNELDANSTSGTTSIPLLEELADESPYSSQDILLLEEFTEDYDEIMVTLIGENYATSLIDMTLPCKIKDLYETKWVSKADTFVDPSLKSYVFGLLGELNNISSSFLASGSATPFLGSSRTKIRNLYVKLHPNQFAGSFPYDAFIDDWDDGEYQ